MRRRELAQALLAAGAVLALGGCRSTPSGAPDTAPPRPTGPQRISYGAEPSQFGELRLPAGPGPHPVAVVIHGGFWLDGYGLDLMTPMCEALTAVGIASWNVEYRRVGEPGGGWPGTLLDAGMATDHLRALENSHALDLDRVVTVGHSAGGHLALWLAARSKLAAGDPLRVDAPLAIATAVSLAGVVDLRRAFDLNLGGGAVRGLLGGSPTEVASRYASASPAELAPLGVPQVLVHGDGDDLVPFDLSAQYVTQAAPKRDTVRLVRLAGAGHFEEIDPATSAGATVVDEVAGASG